MTLSRANSVDSEAIAAEAATKAGRTSSRIRLAAALLIGLAGGLMCAASMLQTTAQAHSDFEYWWRGTSLWLSGVNPYTADHVTSLWPLRGPLYYPLPTLLVTIPFARLPLPVAAGLWFGLASAGLAWVLGKDGLWRLWAFATPGFILAAKLGQWSPLLMLATLVPSLGFVLAAKPSLGLACFAYRPTWRAAIGVALIGAVSLALRPSWPSEWLHNLSVLEAHPAPIATRFGWLLLLALLRWRQPEARLLVAMACVPQLLFFADQLPLALTARTRKEITFLAACNFAACIVWWAGLKPESMYVLAAAPYALVGCYLPALVLVLRRPNEGLVPTWLDAALGCGRGAPT